MPIVRANPSPLLLYTHPCAWLPFSLSLQQNTLESLPEIERCFVHLDYESAHDPEHVKGS